ncbi:transcription factor S-II-domain-containing protein [Cladochytrium replicatum]|nr:transcription factor S-II-domain-containing protein [Cladochytrium replicatum]
MSSDSTRGKKPHSLVFCRVCSSLLDPPSALSTYVVCFACGTPSNADAFENIEVVTRSRPGIFPAPPKASDLSALTNLDGRDQGATITEKCPKCGAPEMVFHTAQLRSADEGQTIFYTCIQCGYKFSTNS